MNDPDSNLAEGPELLPARMLNEFVYCPRLFHLEYVQGEWSESADTLAGSHEHRRVDQESGALPPPEEAADRAGTARSITLSAPDAGIIARLDLVELQDGSAVPVDYKHGRAPDVDEEVWDTDRIQIGAQALTLIENGYRCLEGVVYYVASRRRVTLRVDERLLEDVRTVAARAREALRSEVMPLPLVDSPKCPRCSLVSICLPDESNHLAEQEGTTGKEAEVRRLYPARNDALPVYVQAQGARVGKSGDALEISERDGRSESVRLLDVSEVSLFGNVQISAQALGVLLEREIPVCHFSQGGWFRGITHGLGLRNCHLKLHQYEWARDEGRCLELARGFVERKIRNCRTLLRRNATGLDARVLDLLEQAAEQASRASTPESLLGIEGAAAREYFQAFPRLLKPGGGVEFDFNGRNRRPPRDPINALLSLAYSVLSRDWTIALVSVSLDPHLGFYHRPRHGRPALALDLMEEFRPLIADSVVIQVVNNGEVQESDFLRRGPAVALTPAGRRKFFLAYERRMAHLVRHPAFGYRLSYRRLLEVQSRLFGRHLAGELASYEGFRTR